MAQTAKRVSLVGLAIAEIVAFAVAVGTVGFFVDQTGQMFEDAHYPQVREFLIDIGLFGRQEFFLFATGVGFFIAIFSMVIAIANLQEKTHWAGIMIGVHLLYVLTLLVSSSLLAKTVATLDSSKYKICKRLKPSSSDARCYQLITGVVFGFVSVVLIIADVLIHVFTLTQSVGISFINMDSLTS